MRDRAAMYRQPESKVVVGATASGLAVWTGRRGSGRAKRKQHCGVIMSLPVKVASSEPFQMAKVGLSWDEFEMVKSRTPWKTTPYPLVFTVNHYML